MTVLRLFLLFATTGIYFFTATALATQGFNWPAIAIHDLLARDWRSQFDFDFIIYLLLLALWVSWREGFTAKGHLFGFLSVVMGGMFSFPYLIHAIYSAGGDPIRLLLGRHAPTT